ncbi:MAG: nucleoside monophosphate kinase [Candidatus Curtissbacteria bacterium]|nr:nucleoside monophosphate kinase [Candidatus Curtissbacteria bacterium]
MKLIFLGPQGSGKSTQAKMLAEKLNLPYVEMGQILRDKAEDNDEDAAKIRYALETGNLVPNEITIEALKQRLEKPDAKGGFVLDGYPRNITQLEQLPYKADKAIYVKVSDDEALTRLTKRGRHDDSEDIIKRRLELFHSETEPLISEFEKSGMLIEIDGERTIEEIHEDIRARVQENEDGKK